MTLHITTYSTTSCQLLLLLVHWSYRERNTHAILKKSWYVRRQMHVESILQWLHLQGEQCFWGFIRRWQVKHILIPFKGLDYIAEKYVQNIQNCVMYCVFAWEKTCLKFSLCNVKVYLFVLNFACLKTVAV